MFRGLVLGCLLAASSHWALAENLGPMTFRSYSYKAPFDKPLIVEIQADGTITDDTPQQLRQFLADNNVPPKSWVYFTSRGGSVDGGLEIGRIIRQHRLNTTLQAHDRISASTIEAFKQQRIWDVLDMPEHAKTADLSFPDNARWPSYCISACTLAFLGGVERFVGTFGIFAVHQFKFRCDENSTDKVCIDPSESVSESQKLSAKIAQYLEEMGIPQSFLHDMVLANPSNLNILRDKELEKYQISNWGAVFHDWLQQQKAVK